MSIFIIDFRKLRIEDVPKVGGKNAALGELIQELVPLGVNVPGGCAVTADAFNYFLDSAGIRNQIGELLASLDTRDVVALHATGEKIRTLITDTPMPKDLEDAIAAAYTAMEREYGTSDVAVRSSATAEDLPGASFAGQQETYLNVVGVPAVLDATRRCFASLFTDRAISYRVDKGFSHETVSLSVGIQKMVRSDLACSGVMFSIDTETGFDKVIALESAYGLGEMVVQGKTTPDSFLLFKPSLRAGKRGVIARNIGAKEVKMVYGVTGGEIIPVPEEDRARFSLTDEEAEILGRWALAIEDHFSKKHGHYQPMDMEWAKDGKTGDLFIVQSRPETVHATANKDVSVSYHLKGQGEVTVVGTAVGTKIASGAVRVIKDVANIKDFKEGEVLVTEITDPDWEPIMKIASAIVTDKGGRTSHAAIVSRELGIPCIVGTGTATATLKSGMEVTIDCSSGKEGRVLKGILPFERVEHSLKEIPKLSTKVMVNIGSPEEAFKHHRLPVQGVGLGRLEFIIMSHIRIHPNALIDYDHIRDDAKKDKEKKKIVEEIDAMTKGYERKSDFYVDELAEGIGKIAAAFHPHDVIIRFSDFKTNEYRTLIGGSLYEPEEENPMIGWRGSSRYYDPKFREAFGLECQAIKKLREELGIKNIVPMVPFCRTLDEARKVLGVMKDNGISRQGGYKVYVMCEVPSNVILAEDFLNLFDGMSIGSNDLTQLMLGLDRDSGIVAHVGNETDEAVKEMVRRTIAVCRSRGKYIGICGQAPSDFPEFAAFLVEEGIESVSLSPDTVLSTLGVIAQAEKKRTSLWHRLTH